MSYLQRLRTTAQRTDHREGISAGGLQLMARNIAKGLQQGDKAIDLGTQNGVTCFCLRTGSGSYFYLVNGTDPAGKVLGCLSTSFRDQIEGVYLIPGLRGRGYGTVLYLALIHVMGHARSDTALSIYALRTWKSVSKYHTVRLVDRGTKKPVDFEWGRTGVPVVRGEPIDEGSNLGRYFYFTATK